MLKDQYHVQNSVYCVWDTSSWSKDSLTRVTHEVRNFLTQLGCEEPGYVFQTSGSTARPKFIIHTEHTLSVCAKACGVWLGLSPQDRWMNVLSAFHMGGFSTYFRTEYLGLRPVHSVAWDLVTFNKEFENQQCTLVSLVPTQVYQIVDARMPAPQGLRLSLVGGGALNPDLKLQAQSLGWNILSSLGSTETGSQIFTEELHSDNLGAWALPHFEVKTNEFDELQIKGEGLFKGYLWINEKDEKDFCRIEAVPKDAQGYWTSADRVRLEGRKIVEFYGRSTDQVKILGHLVDLSALRERWAAFVESRNVYKNSQLKMDWEMHLDFLPDLKSENQLVIFVDHLNSSLELGVQEWNKNSLPSERIRGIICVKEIPKSNLGKVQSYLLKKPFLS